MQANTKRPITTLLLQMQIEALRHGVQTCLGSAVTIPSTRPIIGDAANPRRHVCPHRRFLPILSITLSAAAGNELREVFDN